MQNKEFIYNYNFNLVNETDIKIKKNIQESVDYSDKISLIDLITKLNKLYLTFKEEYEKIKKIDISKRVELVDFKENGNIKCLVLNLYGIDVDGNYGTLHIYKSNNIIDSHIKLDSHINRPLFIEPKSIELDIDVINGYFNLLEKYKDLIDMCKLFKEKIVFENNRDSLIVNLNGNILDELDTFDFVFITFGIINMNIIELSYKLGEQLRLLGTIVKIDGEIIGKSDELNKVSQHILENLYIDKPKILDDYEQKVKILKA